jgi:hypothetical protein
MIDYPSLVLGGISGALLTFCGDRINNKRSDKAASKRDTINSREAYQRDRVNEAREIGKLYLTLVNSIYTEVCSRASVRNFFEQEKLSINETMNKIDNIYPDSHRIHRELLQKTSSQFSLLKTLDFDILYNKGLQLLAVITSVDGVDSDTSPNSVDFDFELFKNEFENNYLRLYKEFEELLKNLSKPSYPPRSPSANSKRSEEESHLKGQITLGEPILNIT